MPSRCARCGSFAGRGREMRVPGDWLSYLRRERGVEPVGTLKMPLCTDCYDEVAEIREAGDPDERADLLDGIDTTQLVDEN